MCTGAEALIISAIVGTGTTVYAQKQESKERKKAEGRVAAKELESQTKEKQALVTREQSLSKTRGTAEAAAARSAAAIAETAQTAGTTLGNESLFKRVLG